MAKYYRQQGETKQRKILRIVRPIMLIIFTGSVIGLGYFVYDIFRQEGASEVSSEPTTATTSTITSNIKIQTSPYFQFQTTEKWRTIANETREGHYVYRGFKGQVVDQELVIDVNNQIPEVLATTLVNRVLVVSAGSQGTLNVADDKLIHCKKIVKPGTEKDQQYVNYSQTTFPCNPDSTSYQVVVALAGGNNIMKLPRPDGSVASYKISYRNLSAQETPGDLVCMIKTFTTR